MTDEMKQKVEEIHEGIQNLKGRTNFEKLLHKGKLREVEMAIDRYRNNQQPIESLDHALQIFRETSILTIDVPSEYDATIWDSSVAVKGTTTTLDQLFYELETLVHRLHHD